MSQKNLKLALTMCLHTRGMVMPTSFAEAYGVPVVKVEAMLEELANEGVARRNGHYFSFNGKSQDRHGIYLSASEVTV